MPQDRPGPGPFDDLFERLIGNLESTLGDTMGGAGGRPPAAGGRTPRLDRFGRDLTADAARGVLDPVIGRDAEVDQVLEVLARRTKNNPVLVGDPGVGKTAIAEGIAQRVADGAVPAALRGVRVVALDLAGMVAGTRYRGDFEQRLTGVIDEVVAAERGIVLFVDELHAVVGAGSAEGGAMDAATLLKPALARGELQLIGATTVQEYRRHIEKDAALERRFEPVPIAEPSVEATIAILRGLRPRYEQHHDVRITDAALTAAAELSDRYVPDRFLPDKAIDLLDRASSRARIRAGTPDEGPSGETRAGQDELEQLRRAREVAVDADDFERAHLLTREIEAAEAALGVAGPAGPDLRKGGAGPGGSVEIGPDDVARVVSDSTGIPVAQLTGAERRRLLDLEALLHRRVVGQDAAVETVADAVRAGRAGLAHPDRPVGSFLFLGPTGVGKTELARALAEALFGSADALLRFDMSEYADRSSAMRLVGAPPGHIGYDDAGQLTEAVRRTRYSVLLLDEIEKAHPDVIGTLLQVLDAGRLTDAHGRAVDFTHTVVIMTSNLGAERVLAAGAAGRPVEEVREGVLAVTRLHFRPEFLNRIDDIVLFSALDRAELRQITTLLLAGTEERLRAQGIALEVTPAAVDWLAERGHEPELGARPLRRTIAREVDRALSRLIISEELGTGGRVVVDVHDGGLVLAPQ
ncbi:ATP-dependent Clp protease ATP-binding subunit [Pseudonocardia kunmingensis]|uniref:ATP-dependent Clp protease ATP-binding subunit ClpC n=1 Tax=Pseudonocardia kunmingensis TaxID=630975 RepID=A0A543D4X3_9PSEU|nr:ATP-dependent Clp protease ATP-binding subunit [Pseudonocardia kunmingensis]TQM04374.1 ATP-dependent Clp protease ATP-binding subunit ClpC [Pseudonocardia kunmingensis]